MQRILTAVQSLVETHPDIQVVLSAHPNTSVRADVETALGGVDRVLRCDPLPYPHFIRVLARAHLVLSDSGGIQEETPTFGVPVLVLRDVTERVEAMGVRCARLVGTEPELIVSEATRLLADPSRRLAMVVASNPFGDGRAAERTVAALRWRLRVGERPVPYLPA